jgi:hypothetical protein
MKARISPSWVLGLVLIAASPLFGAQGADQAPQAVTPSQTPSAGLPKAYESPWFTELGKLARAGIEEQVMLSFVDSAGTFNLVPDQIVHLRDLGVSVEIISAILQHDSEIALGLRVVPASTVPESSPALKGLLVAAPAPSAPTTPEAKVETAEKSAMQNEEATPAAVAESAPSVVPQPVACPSPAAQPAAVSVQLAQNCTSPAELSPVRKPYPEQLTNPIIMVRAAGRIPNLVVIEGFPDSDAR